MPRFVAFLRGMNLGRRRITNDELCACFTELGFDNASAFLASGNVVFDSADADAGVVTTRIETGLAQALDYEVPTFLRTGSEVRAIAESRPFTSKELESGGKPQVMLLPGEPEAQARATVLALDSPEDRLVSAGRELYWLPSAGILDSELDFKLIEKAVGPTTMRTKRTLERLAAKYLTD